MLRKISRSTFIWCKYKQYTTVPPVQNPLPPLGFIGLGHFGSAVVGTLLEKGTKIVGYDKDPARLADIAKKGATVATSVANVVEQVDIIFTCMPNFNSLVSILEGLGNPKKRLLLVDLSTIGPVDTFRVQKGLEGVNIDFLSAPAGVQGNNYKYAIFMVGGDEKLLKRAEVYMQLVSYQNKKNVFHVGKDISDGQAARACNILLLACSMVGTAEVMNLGKRLGLEPKLLINALNASSAQCWSVEHYNPTPAPIKTVQASINNKEASSVGRLTSILAVSQDMATKVNAPIPVGALACQIYSMATARGYGEKDFSDIYKLFKETGIKDV